MRSYLIAASIGLAITPAAHAQDDASSPPPLCSDEAYKQFDFWLGDWEVYGPDETFVGTNKISSEEGGCLVVERWTSANGGTGQSYNYYNPASEKWRQVWIGQGSMIDYEGGLTEAGTMKLVGTITYIASGLQADFTGEWIENDNGTVTQHFEQYNSETEEWETWFTGRYVPIYPEPVLGD